MPVMLSTWSFGQRGHAAAWPALAAGGSSLDAVEAAACAVEADEEVDSVGRGGLPDASGNMSLDACVMLSPERCGSVAAVRTTLHVASLARRVMEQTRHIMLAGRGAEVFAAEQGFSDTQVRTEAAHQAWKQWTAKRETVDQSRDSGKGLRPIDGGNDAALFTEGHDTIGTLALDDHGVLAGACSTSGTPYKVPGRVGDSPIIGHGLYVDPKFGAATATGEGERIMSVCGSFLAIERLRTGRSAREAVTDVLQRVMEQCTLQAHDQVGLIVLTPDGDVASGALRSGFKVALRTNDIDVVNDPDIVMIPE